MNLTDRNVSDERKSCQAIVADLTLKDRNNAECHERNAVERLFRRQVNVMKIIFPTGTILLDIFRDVSDIQQMLMLCRRGCRSCAIPCREQCPLPTAS